MPDPYRSNQVQDRAICHASGPMQVLAGPGSGKTYLITRRVRHLIRVHGISPEHILVITFTKAAAEEMKRRFHELTQYTCPQVHFGTFHAAYYHILRNSLSTPVFLADSRDQIKYMKHAVQSCGQREEPDFACLSGLLKLFSQAKSSENPEKYLTVPGSSKGPAAAYDFGFPGEILPRVYREYRLQMEQEHKIDFDDIILSCDRLLAENPEVLAFWQNAFPFLLVDEFQDISPGQYRVLRRLSSPRNNLFVVGDDDQAIYGFRGAGPGSMRQFMEDYPGAEQLTLLYNYRCGSKIVQAAGAVIAENRSRYRKKTVSARTGKDSVRLHSFQSREEEYRYLTECLKKEPPELLSDSAVIFRTNAEAASFSRQLTACRIPFVMKERAQDLFETPVALDLIAYLNFAADSFPDRISHERVRPAGGSRADFFRIMNRPARYFKRACAPDPFVSFSGLMRCYEKNDDMRKTVTDFYTKLQYAAGLRPCLSIDFVRKTMGYDRYLKESLTEEEYAEAVETADAVQKSAAEFATFAQWKASFSAYLDGMKKRKPRDENGDAKALSGIRIITMHASKGLEYTKVWLPNVSEGRIPIKKAFTPEQVEEERRLLYVAMTRARTALEILYYETPSRFLLPLKRLYSVSSSNSALSRYSSKASATSSYSSSSSI